MTKKEQPVTKPLPQVVTVVKEVPTGLDPDMVISFLIHEDVEPNTIVKMIAELNISSGTLMAELCKYMTKKTLEKQATWRPTGYNTAEAQMSTKN
jgi:5,10-methenyltetrahydromethanopterin hydrogenase